MNFFEQLAQLGNVDLTIRIMQKSDKLTMNIMPGSGSASIKPIIVTGTAAELDAEFFSAIAPGLQKVNGLVTNLAEVMQDAEETLKKESKKPEPAKPKPETKKPEAKKPDPPKKKTKPQPVEGSLFEGNTVSDKEAVTEEEEQEPETVD